MIWDGSAHQPVWWAILIAGSALGAIFGALIPVGIIHKLLSYLAGLFREDNFLGTWYYYSGGYVDGVPQPIRECRFEVKKGFLSPYIADSFFPHDSQKPVYTARVLKEGNRLIENFHTLDHKSSGYSSFTRPAQSSERLYGFWCSGNIGDAHDILSCGLIMFCRVRIERERVEHELESGFEFHGSIPSMIRLRASHTPPFRARFR
jgi:hypothetical protein